MKKLNEENFAGLAPKLTKDLVTDIMYGPWLMAGASEEMLMYCLESLPPPGIVRLLEVLRCIGGISGGFRVNRESGANPVVINKLRQEFINNVSGNNKKNNSKVLQNSYLLLVSATPVFKALKEVFELFGEEKMCHFWRKLFALAYDPRVVALAIICYYKEESSLRRLAEHLLHCRGFWKDGHDKQQSKQEQCGVWVASSMFDILEGTQPDTEKTSVEKQQSQQVNLKQLEDARKSIKDLKKQLSDAEKQLEESRNAEAAAIESLNQTRRECEQKIQAMRDELSDKLEKCRWSTTELLTGMDATWVRGSYTHHKTTGELIDNAEKLLEEQRLRNLQYGTVATLKADAEKLLALKRRFSDAISNSLSIHPGMNEMLLVLQKEYDEILQQLAERGITAGGENELESTLLLRMITNIRSIALNSDAPAAIDSIASFIELPQTIELLSPNELAILRLECNRRRGLWHKLSEQRSRQLEKGSPGKPEIWRLEDAFRMYKDGILLVDGYNALLRSAKYSADLKSGKLKLSETRRDFIKKCRESLADRFAQVILVFDGNDEVFSVNDEQSDDTFKVIYARKIGEEHNADIYILDYAKKLGNVKKMLATDDYGLRMEAEPYIDAVVDTMAIHNYVKI